MTAVLYNIGLIISLTVVSSYAERVPNDICAYTKNDPRCDLKAGTNIDNTCYNKECNYTAAYILRNMNSMVDPCDDFYEFVCGGFIESTRISDGRGYVNVFSEMRSKISEQLKASLEDTDTSDIRTISLAKNLYAACMDTDIIEEVGTKPIRNILTQLGSWPVLQGDNWREDGFDWTQSVQKCRELGCEHDWFVAVDVIIDPLNITVHVINVDQPSLGLNAECLITGLENKTVQAYRDYMVDIAVILGADYSTAVKQVTESLAFEIALAKIVVNSETLDHNLITVSDLQKLSPCVNWIDFINSLLVSGITIDETEPVLVNMPSYLSGLAKLLSNTPKRVLANYLMWRVVDSLSEYSINDLREREATFAKELSGNTETASRSEKCLIVVREQLPISIDALYVRDYFIEGTKEAVIELVAIVKAKLIQVIEKTQWMDDDSRAVALDKAHNLNSYIAYPEELLDDTTLDKFHASLQINAAKYLQSILNTNFFWMNYSFAKLGTPVNKTDWVRNTEATVVNAFFDTDQNSIHLPAGILGNPLFGLNRPAYVDWATIGSIAINQMTYAFSDWGSRYDKNGNLLKTSWWSAETRAKYEKNAECIINQYNGYTVETLGLTVNGSRTVEQNILDNSGVTVAYLAYQKFVETYGNELKLSGLTFTQEQLFWISTANIWCSKYESDYLKTYVETDSRSPGKFRVIGPLSNRPEFAKAFNCPVGSTMNPVHKCSVW